AVKARAERSQLDVVIGLALVATKDERMEGGKLAYHLRDHIVQLVAVRHAVDERQISVAHGNPVDALHVRIVIVVALEPPGIEKNAAVLGAGRRSPSPVRKIDFGLAQSLGVGFGDGGIDDVEIILLADEHLLAVGGELEAANAGKDGVGLVTL